MLDFINYEFLIRIVVAGLLGALIGLEREKRFKEAGLRTHFLVAVGSAIIMIISKYAFADIVDGTDVVLDPSRVAAQVVSGIGFLGAGMIIFQRSAIHGLTTAAGIWTTSGIGLAIGAGMYEIGIFGGLLVIAGLEFLKRIFRPIIPHAYQLSVETETRAAIQKVITTLTEQGFTIKDYHVKTKKTENVFSADFKLHSRKKWTDNHLLEMLHHLPEIVAVRFE